MNQNSEVFLRSKLKDLKKLKDIEIFYEYCKIIKVHYVKINYDKNKLIDIEEELEKEFYNLFPSEDLLFVDDDSLCKIRNESKAKI